MTDDYERYATPSSGDAAADRRFLEGFAIRNEKLENNLCPNDDTPLTIISAYERECSSCGFNHTRVPVTVGRDPD